MMKNDIDILLLKAISCGNIIESRKVYVKWGTTMATQMIIRVEPGLKDKIRQ